ncbi:MAG: hypothetical protein Q9218_006315 [Villophora microphyllina]
MTATKKRRKPHLLSHTRPPSMNKTPALSSQATRSLIRKHHTLQKQLHTARTTGNVETAEQLATQIASTGGLQKYQQASLQGQSSTRGGDSSKVLMEWLQDDTISPHATRKTLERTLKMLEVGALTIDNACARSGIFDVTRIDLHSQHPDIQTQDFMEMSMPSEEGMEREKEGFDIVSLSLVVNYVGDPVRRGEMLKRVKGFLRIICGEKDELVGSKLFPSLFLVLPAPCVTNSRYLDEERLEGIMGSLGYVKVRRKMSKKLVYYLWRYEGGRIGAGEGTGFKKQEIRLGGGRNNFAIVVQ